MKISKDNKNKVGRPSICSMTVRKGDHHATIIFSKKAEEKLNIKKGDKVSIQEYNNNLFICLNCPDGVIIKTALSGKGLKNCRISCLKYVNKLLQYSMCENLAVLLIGAKQTIINGFPGYIVIKNPIRSNSGKTSYFTI